MDTPSMVVFSRGDSSTQSNADDDVWDDSALLKAYDDAVKGIRRNKKQRIRPTSSTNDVDHLQETTPQQPQRQAESSPTTNLPNLTAPFHEAVDDDLKRLLQAYFQAGYELGRYVAKAGPVPESITELDQEQDEEEEEEETEAGL